MKIIWQKMWKSCAWDRTYAQKYAHNVVLRMSHDLHIILTLFPHFCAYFLSRAHYFQFLCHMIFTLFYLFCAYFLSRAHDFHILCRIMFTLFAYVLHIFNYFQYLGPSRGPAYCNAWRCVRDILENSNSREYAP